MHNSPVINLSCRSCSDEKIYGANGMFEGFFIFMVVLLIAAPMLGILWSVYVVMEWRGVWRLAASIPFVVSVVCLPYLIWEFFFGSPERAPFADWVFVADLCIIPYLFLGWLAHRGFAGTEDQTTGDRAEA